MDRNENPGPTAEFRSDLRSIRRAFNFIVLFAVIVSFQMAKELFLPMVLAILLTLVLRPVARALSKAGLPSAISAGLIILVLLAVLTGAGYFVAEPAGRWLDDAPNIGREIKFKFRDLIASATAIGDVSKQVQDIADGPKEFGVQEVVVRERGLVSQAASGGVNLLAGGLLCIVLLYFLLATADLFLEKVVGMLPRLRDKVRAVSIAREIESEISRYLSTVTVINLALGLCIAGGMAIAGLPNALLWGGMGAMLNFIPYVGSIVGAGIVLAVSTVTFSEVGQIALPPLIYLALTTIEGHFITPTVLGRRLDMNPVAILVGVAFWGWLWGVAGAVMAAPIILLVKIACDHVDRWTPLAAFLSGPANGARRHKPKSD